MPDTAHRLQAARFTLQPGRYISDLMLFVYIAVFVRQYLWTLPHQRIAWVVTILITGLLWILHAREREKHDAFTEPSKPFWIGVALPLLLIYAARVAFPDFSGDTMNYHLVHAERALRGWPFMSGDFFPTVLPINPAPDMVTGIFRHVLGHRLGTIVNYLALVWTAQIIDRTLRPYIKSGWLRVAGVIACISSEYVLRIMTNYMVDLLALPLLFEATRLALNLKTSTKKNYTLVHIGMLLGMSAAFKFSSIVSIIPITLLTIYHLIFDLPAFKIKYMALALAAFLAPLVPFSLYIYWQTGNPAFPFFNGLFKSPYMIAENFKDPDLGPQSFWEAALWPVYGFLYPARSTAYLLDFMRISLGFFTAAICLVVRGTAAKKIGGICFITLCGTILWCFASGNPRYALHIEMMGCLTVVALAAAVLGSIKAAPGASLDGQVEDANPLLVALKTRMIVLAVCSIITVLALVTFSLKAYVNLYRNNWWNYGQVMQPSVFDERAGYFAEARNILQDHDGRSYLSDSEKKLFDNVEVWINSLPVTSGLEVTLKPDIPIIAVCDYYQMIDYLQTEASRKRLATALQQAQGKRLFSLSYPPSLELSLHFIERAGLKAGQITFLDVPYYSSRTRLNIALIEILPAPEETAVEARR